MLSIFLTTHPDPLAISEFYLEQIIIRYLNRLYRACSPASRPQFCLDTDPNNALFPFTLPPGTESGITRIRLCRTLQDECAAGLSLG